MDTTSAWGKYAPPAKSWPIRFLVAIGLGRGKFKKTLIRAWQRRFGAIIDIPVKKVKYRLNIQNNVTDRKVFISSKEYDRRELLDLKTACRTASFIDIGANIGYYSLALAISGVNEVVAIEPNPPTLARLRYNIGINHLENKITVLPIGIGEEGLFELFSRGDLGSASLLKNSEVKTDSVTISTHPLFEVLTDLKIEKIGGMKIDVEGIEDRVLLPFFKTAPKTMWPSCLVIEHCNQDDWQTDIISYLIGAGYNKKLYTTRGNTVLRNPDRTAQ
jgi:FkbM family methyltransferase